MVSTVSEGTSFELQIHDLNTLEVIDDSQQDLAIQVYHLALLSCPVTAARS